MHAIEKILAKNSNKKKVKAGDIVVCDIDFAQINDLYLQTIYSFYEIGGDKVWDKDKVAFVFDHFSPAPDINSAENQNEMREFMKKNNLRHHFDINEGVCHQVLAESGIVKPSEIVVATDSHTTTHGALGAFGTGCGATDMAIILKTGKLWFRIPEIINIDINGEAKDDVFAKDVILYILSKIKADGAVYKAIDFSGDYVDKLSISERMTICNMAVEMGAKTAYMSVNDKVISYLDSIGEKNYDILKTDKDFKYNDVYHFDVSEINPMISCPDSVDNVLSVSDLNNKIKINQCYLGSCTNGRSDDIEIAAKILKGKKINENVRLIVAPASNKVLLDSMESVKELIKSGATLATPGCGACLGVHLGILGKGEVCVSSTNRNFPGRMGSNESKVYLASPATVAKSALDGYISSVDLKEL